MQSVYILMGFAVVVVWVNNIHLMLLLSKILCRVPGALRESGRMVVATLIYPKNYGAVVSDASDRFGLGFQ